MAQAARAIVKAKPLGRSPAEKAFDFLALPIVLNFILLAASILLRSFNDSDGKPIDPPAALTRALQCAGTLSLVHWLAGLRKVWCSWQDPFGKVLRFSSVAILAMQALVIMEALGLLAFLRRASDL